MSAINTSISYQSQFAPSNANYNDFQTKSDERSKMIAMKEIDLKPISPKYSTQNITLLGDIGKHVNLRV